MKVNCFVFDLIICIGGIVLYVLHLAALAFIVDIFGMVWGFAIALPLLGTFVGLGVLNRFGVYIDVPWMDEDDD